MDELRRMDLNLLLSLHALLAEKHVTRAALRLHRSQPAVSHALAQLRDLFDDPLLVRRGSTMELTPRAQELVEPLASALEQLNALVRQGEFDPTQAQRRFRISCSDYGARIVLPPLVRHLREHAPMVDLAVSQGSRESMVVQLLEGEVDIAIGVFPEAPQQVLVDTLFEEHYISVADARTLPARGALKAKDWLARPHVLVAVQPHAASEIDIALASKGLSRRIAVTLPHWSASVDLVEDTDLVLTVASRLLERPCAGNPHVRMFKPPVQLPTFAFQQAWHTRRQADPAHRWLREVVHACSQSVVAV